jgi:cyclopropane-fatty-acyl-phospholipid synthase
MRVLSGRDRSLDEGAAAFVGAGALRSRDRALRRLLRGSLGPVELRFVLADGTVLSEGGPGSVATVAFRDRATLLRVLLDPEGRFGDAYSSGRVEVHGDLVAALEAVYHAVEDRASSTSALILLGRHTLRASRDNVHRHYDLGNEFYRLWLDDQMLYTSAYFPSPDDGLEDAQVAKMDHVCRKLRLRPGESVVEAGSGWGALALHMARHYGVTVTAYNISTEQVRYSRDRAAREGLEGRVVFLEDDYRRIRGRFDAFVSLGMLEHVGLENYRVLGEVIDRCLARPHGRGLLHFIGRDQPGALNAWIRQRIFPGACPPTLGQMSRGVLEHGGFSILDVENLRLHYAVTLAHWRSRFENAMDEVAARFGEAFARSWRLYLAGSEAAFRSGSLQLFQVTFARRGFNDLPWTRAELYPWRDVTP